MILKDREANDFMLIRESFQSRKGEFKMPNKTRAGKRIPFTKDSVEKSLVLQEVRFKEIRKSLIRKEEIVLEPITNQDIIKLVIRQDDQSKPWYISHV